MGDESIINSPGQLRLFEQDHGWLPGDTAGAAGGTGTSTGSAIGSMAGGEAGSADTAASNGTGGSKPFTWQQGAQNAAFTNGGYFSHDNKLYQQRDGKTYLITGDPSGDVELDAEQSGQLDMARAATAEQEKKTKDAMAQQGIVTEGFTPNPDGRNTKPFEQPYPIEEFAKGVVNKDNLNEAQMYQASLPRQIGSLAEEARSGISVPNAYKAHEVLNKWAEGQPLTDEDKWVLWKTGANVAGEIATWTGAGKAAQLAKTGVRGVGSVVRKVF